MTYELDKYPIPIQPIYDQEKLDWLEELTYQIECLGDMDRSDAQGFLDCRQTVTQQCWEKGLTPVETFEFLLENEAIL